MDLDPYRHDKQFLIQELRNAGAEITKDGREVRCPFHDDKTPSSGVYQDEAGNWKFTCQADSCGFSGDVFDVIAKATGKDVNDVLGDWAKADHKPVAKSRPPEPKKPARVYPTLEELERVIEWSDKDKGGKITRKFSYTNPDTKRVDLLVYRLDRPDGKKSFRQAHLRDGGYCLEKPEGLQPIYNRARVRSAATVLVVEGEKCVHILTEYGFVATTSPGGAGKAALADWSVLAGKTVVLWADCDKPNEKNGQRTGLNHMREVAEILQGLQPAPNILWIEPDDLELPDGEGDCEEYIKKLGTTDKDNVAYAIQALIDAASPMGCAKGVVDQINDAILGKRKAIPTPWPRMNSATRALLPGTVTVIAGPAGHGKSFWLLQALMYMWENGEIVSILELEEDRDYHLRRALAMRAMVADLCNDKWCFDNPDRARLLANENIEFMNGFGPCISWFESGALKANDVIKWVEDKLKAGVRVIAVDPVTAVDGGKDAWLSDFKIVMETKALVRKYKASAILVTHPKKGSLGLSMDDLAGSTAYSRFPRTVIHIKSFDRIQTGSFKMRNGEFASQQFNRQASIWKARDSYGAGLDIGFNFNRKTFRFEELGVIDERPEESAEPVEA